MADNAASKRPGDAVDLNEEASPREKKMRASINDVAADLLCPITQELPFDPVMAKDGKIYERTAILEWFRNKDGEATSPSTGKVIGTELLPAVQVRNTIESLIKSGAIEGEAAEAWQKKLADEILVKDLRAAAEGGNGDAMYNLGVWYELGGNGLAKDDAQARAWYERGAAARDKSSMAKVGERRVFGFNGPQNIALGIMDVTEAAHLGSDLGAFLLGDWMFHGHHGLPKDPVRARPWLKKVVDGGCKPKILGDVAIAEAARMLRELDGAGD